MTDNRAERLAKALLADRAAPPPPPLDLTHCFACGVRMLNRGSRFCSDRCRSAYDNGFPGYDQDWLKPSPNAPWRLVAGPALTPSQLHFATLTMRTTSTGSLIQCAGCFKEFNSKGLRSCSPECERLYNERQRNRATMAEVGVTPKPKRTCQAPGCNATIPQWTNGKRTPSSRRFCSPKCSARSRRQK